MTAASRPATRRSSPARLILYVGKGGVGKTTLAAATAVRSAELGHRTLVVSADIAHSLGDVLNAELSAEPRELGERLFAQEVNVLDEVRRSWGKVQGEVAEFLRREGMSEIQADELAIIPGMEEVAALVQIERQGRSGQFECVIVDAAPTGETIRLLSMPDSFQWYANRVEQWRARLGRLAGPILGRVLPNFDVVDVMRSLSTRVKQLRAALTDAGRSSYRLVLTPDRTVLKEAQRAETYLNLFEYPVDAVFVNRVLKPPSATDAYLEALVARQQRLLGDVRTAFPTLPLFEVPLEADEPVGTEALARLARGIFESGDPTAVLHVGPSQTVERRGTGYVLRIPMPNVEVERLGLTKRGDELYVDLGNIRREIPLPLALAALEPGVARLRGGILEVPFQADASDAA